MMQHHLNALKRLSDRIIKIFFLTSIVRVLEQVCLTFSPKVMYFISPSDRSIVVILNNNNTSPPMMPSCEPSDAPRVTLVGNRRATCHLPVTTCDVSPWCGSSLIQAIQTVITRLGTEKASGCGACLAGWQKCQHFCHR